ncbi:ATP-binding cassette domain-containing protein, partial [Virgibacillus salexigens]|uniref:ATP-binding cassette domain-containing protein n=1 Tax=Virgibacillus salexigens TaxID=61016 RepID=UPI003081FCDB
MLTVNNLSMSYGKNQIFSDLTFTVHSGEIVGLVGENGAGKSTLLRVLATLQKPKSGTVQLNNFTYLADKNKIRQLIG